MLIICVVFVLVLIESNEIAFMDMDLPEEIEMWLSLTSCVSTRGLCVSLAGLSRHYSIYRS